MRRSSIVIQVEMGPS